MRSEKVSGEEAVKLMRRKRAGLAEQLRLGAYFFELGAIDGAESLCVVSHTSRDDSLMACSTVISACSKTEERY
jgi:hypothetical protein